MRQRGARPLTVTSAQALSGTRLLGGPIRLVGWSLNDGTASSGSTVDQSAAAPGAGATIASISLGNGLYSVAWTFELTGTPAAADVDNVQLFIGGTLLATSVNLGAVGNYPQEEAQALVTIGPLTLAWKALGAATAGTTYKIEANITPLTQSTGTIRDGGQNIAFVSMPPQGVSTVYLDENGVNVDTEISVQTTLGLIQGTLWYYTGVDSGDPHAPDYYVG